MREADTELLPWASPEGLAFLADLETIATRVGGRERAALFRVWRRCEAARMDLSCDTEYGGADEGDDDEAKL